jgi:hypothetical protein
MEWPHGVCGSVEKELLRVILIAHVLTQLSIPDCFPRTTHLSTIMLIWEKHP